MTPLARRREEQEGKSKRRDRSASGGEGAAFGVLSMFNYLEVRVLYPT